MWNLLSFHSISTTSYVNKYKQRLDERAKCFSVYPLIVAIYRVHYLSQVMVDIDSNHWHTGLQYQHDSMQSIQSAFIHVIFSTYSTFFADVLLNQFTFYLLYSPNWTSNNTNQLHTHNIEHFVSKPCKRQSLISWFHPSYSNCNH